MELMEKLSILADAAKYDASCASSGSKRKGTKGLGSTQSIGICHSYAPDGRCISLLKILLTNYCIYDCKYCVNRISSDTPRARFSVEEVVWLTVEFYRRNYIEGLFLSSGIIRDTDYTMDQLAEVARRLREEENFAGYIHLKAVPGASADAIAKAGKHADRLSANVELPTQDDLDELAPAKTFDDVEDTMGKIKWRHEEAREERKKSQKAPNFSPAGQSTQMIVGATPSTDLAILKTSSRLYESYRLKRVYYSAFSPIPEPDPSLPPASPPLLREHRLYQADWLMRFYGFDVAEIADEKHPQLDLDIDPKLAWALRNRHRFPVDLNRASKEEILRVPGIGTRSAGRIIKMRRYKRITLEDLEKLRCAVHRAKPFVFTEGRNPALRHLDDLDLRRRFLDKPRQLTLFEAAQSASMGQV